MSNDKCPKCEAEIKDIGNGWVKYACGSEVHELEEDGSMYMPERCLRSQLAQAEAKLDEVRGLPRYSRPLVGDGEMVKNMDGRWVDAWELKRILNDESIHSHSKLAPDPGFVLCPRCQIGILAEGEDWTKCVRCAKEES